MKRVKSLFIAASIVAVVVGSIQIAGNVLDFGKSEAPNVTTAKAPDSDAIKNDTTSAKPAMPGAKPAAPDNYSRQSA